MLLLPNVHSVHKLLYVTQCSRIPNKKIPTIVFNESQHHYGGT